MSLSPLLIAAVFFLLNHNPLAIKDDDYKEEVISYLKSEMDKKKIPGLQVAIIRNNEIKWILSLQGHKFLKKKESISQMWDTIKLSNGEYGGFGGDLNAYALGWPVTHRNKHPVVAPIG